VALALAPGTQPAPPPLRCMRCKRPGVLVHEPQRPACRVVSSKAARGPWPGRDRSKTMSVGDATEHKEVEINALDQRFSSLRLHCPREFSRLRAHILQTGLCDPVLVSTQVEPGCLVLIDDSSGPRSSQSGARPESRRRCCCLRKRRPRHRSSCSTNPRNLLRWRRNQAACLSRVRVLALRAVSIAVIAARPVSVTW
jgi:hypothetical protein